MPIHNKPDVNDVFSSAGTNVSKPNPEDGYLFGTTPNHYEHNYLFNKGDNMNKHINEAGIPEWDVITPYSKGSRVGRVVAGDTENRRIYLSKIDSNVNNVPETSVINWEDITDKAVSAGYAQGVGGNDITATISYPKITEYIEGQQYYIRLPITNTSMNPTLNINGIGAIPIVTSNATNVDIGDLRGGHIANLVFANARFYLLNSDGTTQGSIVQTVSTFRTSSDVASPNFIINISNPLSSEGKSFLSLTITPRKINNTLVIEGYITYILGRSNILGQFKRVGSVLSLNRIGGAKSLQIGVNSNSMDANIHWVGDSATTMFIKQREVVSALSPVTFFMSFSPIHSESQSSRLESKSTLVITEIES